MDMGKICRNGDIFIARLPQNAKGSIQNGERPVLIVSNDMANRYSPVINILPITSSCTKAGLPVHVMIEGFGLWKKSLVMAEQITSLDKWRLEEKIGNIRDTKFERQIKEAMGIQLNLLEKTGYIT